MGVSDTWDGGWNTALGTTILYIAHVNVAEPKEVLNIGFLSHFLFQQPCSLPFYTTIASNSYIPPTVSLENVFFTCLHSPILVF